MKWKREELSFEGGLRKVAGDTKNKRDSMHKDLSTCQEARREDEIPHIGLDSRTGIWLLLVLDLASELEKG